MRRPALALALCSILSSCAMFQSTTPNCPTSLSGLDYVGTLDDWPDPGGYWVDHHRNVLAWTPSEDSPPPNELFVMCNDTHDIFQFPNP